MIFLKIGRMNELEGKLILLQKKVEELKQESIQKNLFDKIESICRYLGRWDDWWGGMWVFNSRQMYMRHYDYGVRVEFPSGDKNVVFSCKKEFGKYDLSIYKKGEWEELIEGLYLKSIEEKEKRGKDNTQKNIEELESRFSPLT
jgi:hypothetical protein